MSTLDSTQDEQSTTVMDNSPRTPSTTDSATTDVAPEVAFHPNILQCFICKEPPTDPISTSCGDVFCWPCMHQKLQNGPTPCPACGHTLRRDLDIIPLYSAGASTNTGTIAGTNTSRETTCAIDIPPRPRNPLLRTATPTPTPMPIPTVDNSGSENLTSANFVRTPSSLLNSYERSIHHLSESLETERARVMNLGFDCIDLQLEMPELEHQHTELRRAMHDLEWVLGQERDEAVRSGLRVRAMEERNRRLAWEAEQGRERERRHIERGNQMAALIARLEQRLEVVDRQLPHGWRARELGLVSDHRN